MWVYLPCHANFDIQVHYAEPVRMRSSAMSESDTVTTGSDSGGTLESAMLQNSSQRKSNMGKHHTTVRRTCSNFETSTQPSYGAVAVELKRMLSESTPTPHSKEIAASELTQSARLPSNRDNVGASKHRPKRLTGFRFWKRASSISKQPPEQHSLSSGELQ